MSTAKASAPGTSPLHARQLLRLQGEYHLIHSCSLLDVTPGNIARGIVFLAVARACIGDWTRTGAIAPPADVSEGVSILSIADSLHHPFETVRRHVHALVETGLCTRDQRRVALATTGPSGAAILTYLTTAHDNLLRLIAEIVALEDVAPPPAGAPSPMGTVGLVLRASLDLSLTPIEHSRKTFANWTTMIVWGAVATLTVRHVTVDPTLGRTLSHRVTPDAMRRPVPMTAIAAAYRLPYATVWKHARDLVSAGLLTQTPGGLRMTNDNLTSGPMAPQVVAGMLYLLRKLRETILLAGVDPARIADFYVAGPPPYVPWPNQASPDSSST